MVVLDNEGHALAVGVEGELFEDLVAIFPSLNLIIDYNFRSRSFFEVETDLSGALQEGQLIRARRLVRGLAGSWVNVDDHGVTNSEEAEESIKILITFLKGITGQFD